MCRVGAKDACGYTALMHASGSKSHHELARVLLEAGANPNMCNRFGRTALHDAAGASDKKAVQLLLE